MYAQAGNHHGGGRAALWLNAPLGVQEMLVGGDPEKYFVPPYVGVKGWIGVALDHVDDAELGAARRPVVLHDRAEEAAGVDIAAPHAGR